MGWLEGGYQTLIDALERADPRPRRRDARRHGGGADRRLDGARHGPRPRRASSGRSTHVLCTLAPPQARQLLSPRARGQRARGSLPLPRRHLPPAAGQAQRQPVLPLEHHRPARAADDDRRDDARRRSRRTSAAPCSTSPSTSTRLIADHERPLDEVEARLPRARADDLSRPARRRDRSTRSCSARGSRSRSTFSAAPSACPTCSRCRAWPSPRPRTSTRRSSAARRSSGSPTASCRDPRAARFARRRRGRPDDEDT